MTSSLLIIAEIGSVHDGSFGNAGKLIEAAAAAGANAVKFQTHIAEAETLANAPMPSYFKGEPRMAYFRRTAFSLEQHRELAGIARSNGVQFLSSPFSLEAVDLLEQVDMPIYKIPSGEVSNLPLLQRVAATGKPVLLSSGMSNWRELDEAVAVLRTGGPLTLMQCSSLYPCPPEQVGLNVMVEMGRRYGVPFGLSDHTMGPVAPIAAVTLGADTIEKHFTFSRLMYGSDARHSMEPEEFRLMTGWLQEAWRIRRSPVDKTANSAFAEMKKVFEKSIVLASALPAGTILERVHLAFKKPGDGIPAARYADVAGRRLRRDLAADHKLDWKDLS